MKPERGNLQEGYPKGFSTVEKTHEEEVRKAFSNGENVPEAVLVDYPDLQRCSE